jgi:hypothetical protein
MGRRLTGEQEAEMYRKINAHLEAQKLRGETSSISRGLDNKTAWAYAAFLRVRHGSPKDYMIVKGYLPEESGGGARMSKVERLQFLRERHRKVILEPRK